MTTDPFTEAAADAAVASHDRELGPGFNGAYSGNYCIGFEQGAEWARTHLAAQELDDAEVEAAAIECVKFLFLTAPERPWENPEVVKQWEPMARIALRSALAARAGRVALAEGGEVR